MKNVGKPCEGEPHARIDGGELETGRAVARATGSGRPGETSGMSAGAYRCGLLPRQLPTRLRFGVSHDTFRYLRAFIWRQVFGWVRRKYRRSNWKALRRTTCGGGWWPTTGEVTLFDPAKVRTIRYSYRGSKIPPPWPRAAG